MGDIDRRWPAWKFGMKQNDLFTKLHDQYNTFPSSIQDPEAFHHDVYEISTTATDVDQFHSMLANRKIQRLQELNDALESAALEIIANPNLIGTEQWAFAVQLFRTRSLDSLVRYFASYLPSSHPWHKGGGQPDETDGKQQKQQGEQQQHQTTTFFDEAVVTHEPLSIADGFSSDEDVRSPRSLTTYSDDSDSTNLTSSRTLSFSESEPDQIDLPVYCKPDFSKQPTAHVEVVDSDVVVAVAVTDKKESTAAAEPIVVKLDELLAVEPVQVTETKQAVAVKNSDNTDATTNSNKTAFTSPTSTSTSTSTSTATPTTTEHIASGSFEEKPAIVSSSSCFHNHHHHHHHHHHHDEDLSLHLDWRFASSPAAAPSGSFEGGDEEQHHQRWMRHAAPSQCNRRKRLWHQSAVVSGDGSSSCGSNSSTIVASAAKGTTVAGPEKKRRRREGQDTESEIRSRLA